MKINIDKIKREKPIKELIKFSIINIDKPSGPTSFEVSQFVKESLDINKTSHFGTLDPQVSGILPVALGRACRLSDYFMHRNKKYVGIMRLHSDLEDGKLQGIIKKFVGKIRQLPPVKSSVKREIREREVLNFRILEREGRDVLFETEVQAGTYIRKLCDDIGKETDGAHMLELRRIEAGRFNEIDCVNLYEFERVVGAYKRGDDEALRSILLPAEIISIVLPVIRVKKQVVKKILSGSPIFETFLEDKKEISKIKKEDKICLFSGEQFIGCYNFIGDGTLIAKPEFVMN